MTSAIQVEGLGKQYRLGVAPAGRYRYRNLRDAVAGWLKSPFRHAAPAQLFWALRDLSFDVQQGEVVGIIGRNGAGKSTLLKILSQITEPSTGRAIVHGRVGSLLEVGTGFHPELTGRENVFLNGAILGMSRSDIRRRFDEIVAFAEVEKFLDTAVRHYSSGMYMRLAFSVAAHLEPEVLIVDEVLAVGDIAFQQKCLGKMESVSSEGRTVLFVSHNMPAVTRLCSRAILLHEGRLLKDASAEETVSFYLQGAVGTSESRTWEPAAAPGTGGVKLLGLAVVDDGGQPARLASVGDPLRLRVTYSVAEPQQRFRIMIALNTQGVCAFSAVEPKERLHEQAGVYEADALVPPHLLAEGEYTVDATIFASRGVKQRLARVKDAVAFQVYDPLDGTSARGDYAEGFLGVMRPKLEWQTRYRPAATLEPSLAHA